MKAEALNRDVKVSHKLTDPFIRVFESDVVCKILSMGGGAQESHIDSPFDAFIGPDGTVGELDE